MKYSREIRFRPSSFTLWALGLLSAFALQARAGLSSLEVYQSVEQIVGETAIVLSPDRNNNCTQWTLGTSRARFIMKGFDAVGNPLIAGMEVKPTNFTGPLGQGTNSLMIARTVDSQTVKDTGTISINLKAPSSYTLDLEFSFYDAPGGICDWKTPRALPLLVSSFDIDFEQRYAFKIVDFLYLQTEKGSPLTRSTAGDHTILTGASGGSIPSDAKSGVYAVTKGGSSFRLRLSHDATALFLLEFRAKPKTAPP